MTDTQIYERIVEILHKEVVYATGCTEPIALAYAAAVARKHLGCTPDKIEAFVSPNLMKNGMAVKVPGTGLPGMDVAAAVGVTGGDPNGGLDVLHHLSAEAVEKAKDLLAKKRSFPYMQKPNSVAAIIGLAWSFKAAIPILFALRPMRRSFCPKKIPAV